MSRIGDALKQAGEKDRSSQPIGKSAPIAPNPTQSNQSRPLLLGTLAIFLVAAAFWFLSRAVSVRQNPPRPPVASNPIQPAPTSIPVSTPKPATPVITPVAPPTPAPAPAPPTFPAVHLQAIFYTASNPRALINGSTCQPGDEVSGVRVVKIEPDKVTLRWNGQDKVLTMQN